MHAFADFCEIILTFARDNNDHPTRLRFIENRRTVKEFFKKKVGRVCEILKSSREQLSGERRIFVD